MDFNAAVRQLREELKQVERAIRRLEARQVRATRGRKSMPAAERQEVSRRMKEYWAKRRSRQSGQ